MEWEWTIDSACRMQWHYEMVAVSHACFESCAVARVQRFTTCICNKNNFTLKHPDEFVLMFMPVSLGGPGAGLDTHEIYAELGQVGRPSACVCLFLQGSS